MDQQEIKKNVLNILDNSYVGTMATVKQNKPHSRYMTFLHDGMKLFTVTSKDTHKAEDLKENPNTHILLGYDGEGFGDDYVEYEGKVTISNDEEKKTQLWDDKLKIWFEGPNDPNLIVLEIEPTFIRLMNKKGEAPKELKF